MFITKSYQAQFQSIFTFLTKKAKITTFPLCHIIALKLLQLPGYKKIYLYNRIKKNCPMSGNFSINERLQISLQNYTQPIIIIGIIWI